MAEIVTTISTIMIVSSIVLLLLDRLSHPTIPAYIITGILLNYFIIGEQLISFAELGIIFLVFIFGLRTEPKRLSSVAYESALSTIITTTVVGTGAYIAGVMIGLDPLNALYFSIAASISSSLVGLELIEKDIRADLLHGRLAESMHLLQDLIAILFIIVTGAIASSNFIFSLLTGISVIFFALIIRSYFIDHIMRLGGESRELTMLTALGVLTGFIAITELVQLSTVVGSFAAGLAMAKFPHNTESLDTIKPMRDFFSAIFFVSLGTLLTFPSAASLFLTGLLVFTTLILKPLLTAFYLIHVGYDHRTAYLTGFSLDQVSEFALMIGIQAFVAGTMNAPLFHAIVMAATITMITSSYTSKYGEKIYLYLSKWFDIDEKNTKIEERTDVGSVNNHVIIIGYGTQGKKLAKATKEAGKDVVIIENDPEKITEARKNTEHYVFGDAVDDKTWKAAKADKASLIISTVPSHQLSEEILNLDVSADKVLRTPEVEEAKDLMEKGAFFVEVPDLVASEQLVDHINQVVKDVNTKEELRRRNILELRQELNK